MHNVRYSTSIVERFVKRKVLEIDFENEKLDQDAFNKCSFFFLLLNKYSLPIYLNHRAIPYTQFLNLL